MMSFECKGDFLNFKKFANEILHHNYLSDLHRYGALGVEALSRATPIDTGLAEHSWYYKIVKDRRGYLIQWCNRDVEGGALVVILVQYGHGTRSGTYVHGKDFVNPAMRHVFDEITDDVWKKVKL